MGSNACDRSLVHLIPTRGPKFHSNQHHSHPKIGEIRSLLFIKDASSIKHCFDTFHYAYMVSKLICTLYKRSRKSNILASALSTQS